MYVYYILYNIQNVLKCGHRMFRYINGEEWDDNGIYPTWLWLTVRHGKAMAHRK